MPLLGELRHTFSQRPDQNAQGFEHFFEKEVNLATAFHAMLE